MLSSETGIRAPLIRRYTRTTFTRVIQNDPIFGETERDRADLLARGGLTIRTTLDLKAQKAADEALKAKTNPTDKVAAALASVEPGTGKILAPLAQRQLRFCIQRGLRHRARAVQPAAHLVLLRLVREDEHGFARHVDIPVVVVSQLGDGKSVAGKHQR